MRIATPAFFWGSLAWKMVFHPFTFSLDVSLGSNESLVDSIWMGHVFLYNLQPCGILITLPQPLTIRSPHLSKILYVVRCVLSLTLLQVLPSSLQKMWVGRSFPKGVLPWACHTFLRFSYTCLEHTSIFLKLDVIWKVVSRWCSFLVLSI